MVKSKGGLVLTPKHHQESSSETAVNACQGWTDPCDFCDRRFNSWDEVVEDSFEKIPTMPGVFQIALRNKGVTEVVVIVLDKTDIQKQAFGSVDRIKERIADKKSKSTKASVLIRWLTFKNPNDKDVITLCAHWRNSGVLPKEIVAWPGADILQNTTSLVFSDKLQKWCYPKRDAFWKKQKSPPSKLTEVIESCDWNGTCEICEANFSKWMKLEDAEDMAPDESGIFMVAVCVGKAVLEVIDIVYDNKDIKLNIKKAIQNSRNYGYFLKDQRFANIRNATIKVRWAQFRDAASDNCCYMYAHWINAQSENMPEYRLPGDAVLVRHKNFVLRSIDKKWCYEIDALKQMRITKHKNKKYAIEDLQEDMKDLNCS